MTTLEARLNAIRESAKDRIPEKHRERMHRATAELEESGAAAGAVGEGAPAPTFELSDSQSVSVELLAALKPGPLVVTFFRGHW